MQIFYSITKEISRHNSYFFKKNMNFETGTARYVGVWLEHKKEALDAYHGTSNRRPRQRQRKQSRSSDSIRQGPGWPLP